MSKKPNSTICFFVMNPTFKFSIFHKLVKKLNAVLCYGKMPKNLAKYSLEKPTNGCTIIIEKIKNLSLHIYNKTYIYFQNVFPVLFKYRPKVVIEMMLLADVTIWFLLIMRYFFGFKIIFWTHSWNKGMDIDPEKRIKDRLRLFLIKKADAVILYNNLCKRVWSKFVADSDKLFVVKNVLDTEELSVIRNEYEKIGKTDLKKSLGFGGKKIITFIGIFNKDKNISYILRIFEEIHKKDKNVVLLLIGDGPERENLEKEIKDRKVENVVFLGLINDDRIVGKYLFISDFILHPGLVGLSIIHGYCFDKPIITEAQGENGPFHGTEIEYLKNGKTGFICNNDNIEDIVSKCLLLLNNKDLQNYMQNNIREFLKYECNTSIYINAVHESVKYVLLKQ